MEGVCRNTPCCIVIEKKAAYRDREEGLAAESVS